MKKLLVLLFLGLSFAKAQIYAPDTTFRFQNANFSIPSHKYRAILASSNKFTLVNLEYPKKDENYYPTPPPALIDSSGKVVETFDNRSLIPNSFDESGFWLNSYLNDYSNDSTFILDYYDLTLLKKTPHHFKKITNSLNDPKIENGYLIDTHRGSDDTDVFIYNLTSKSFIKLSTKSLYKTVFEFQKYYVQDIRIDKEQNIWLLIFKAINYFEGNLQLYKIAPNETLNDNSIIFEKTPAELSTNGAALWQNAKFSGDTIILQRVNDYFTPRELVKIDLKGDILPFKVSLPLLDNDPNTNYSISNLSVSDYIILTSGKNQYAFVDKNGLLSHLDLSDKNIISVLTQGKSIFYTDNLFELHEIDISTLKEVESSKKAPIINYEAGIVYIQSLDNNDYWVAYKNPYNTNSFFIKFHQNKRQFSYPKEVLRGFYAGKNDFILQATDGEKVLIDGQNKSTILSTIEGEIVLVDTTNKHIYTNFDNQTVYRYNYKQQRDSTFNWEGGKLKSNLVVSNTKKVHYLGNRFNFDGSIDKTFASINISDSDYGGKVYRLNKLWDKISFVNGSCSHGCAGAVYQWSASENQPVQVITDVLQYLYKYLYLAGRDSLLLDGFNKILPDLSTDSNFVVKGRFDTKNIWNTIDSRQYKPIDILPNHDLLVNYNNQIYRLSPKNSVWVEIRNLPELITLSDSLIQAGIMLDVFSSDKSTVKLQLKASSEKVAHLEGEKLVLEGKEGVVTLLAQSVKGGQPFEISLNIRKPILQISTIKATPNDTSLFINFTPFRFTYSSDINVPLSVKVEGNAGYLKDGMIHPTGKLGYIYINISHEATSTNYANEKHVYWQVNRHPQTVESIDLKLVLADFPFKIPFTTSAQLPIDYTINSGLEELFIIKKDTIYLNPEFRTILKKHGWYNYGSPISFAINGTQEGNALFAPISFSFNTGFDYWSSNLNLPDINVYPTIFNETINISGPDINELSDIYLLDTQGQKVADLKHMENNYRWIGYTSSKKDKLAALIDTRNIQEGNYLLVFKLSGVQHVRKVMK